MTIQEKMDALVSRCSKFSGFNLGWKTQFIGGVKCLVIEDPADQTNDLSSRLVLREGIGGKCLYEVYGRLWHWAVSMQEQDTLLEALKAS